jgi:hypothetical protein
VEGLVEELLLRLVDGPGRLVLLAHAEVVERVEHDDPEDVVRRVARARRDRREEVPAGGAVRGHADLVQVRGLPRAQLREERAERRERHAVLLDRRFPQLLGDPARYSCERVVRGVVALSHGSAGHMSISRPTYDHLRFLSVACTLQ